MKVIPNYPNYYACKKGNIYSTKRKGTSVLKSNSSVNRYRKVTLSNHEGRKDFKIHVLIMLVFEGERPKGLEINHINGDRFDNRLSNLEYCTPSENQKHAYKLGLKKPQRGETNGYSKLSKEQVVEIKIALLNLYRGINVVLAKKYNVSKDAISNIRTQRTWSHINI